MPILSTPVQCPTCRFNVLTSYILAGKPAESRGCARHIVIFPNATTCRDYEREPGTD